MKYFFSLIAAFITFGFSNIALSDSGNCSFTVFYWAKYGGESDLAKSIKSKCEFDFTSCETMNDGFITVNPKNLSVTHQLTGISREKCDEKALQMCRYLKDENTKNRTVTVWFLGERLSAYMCGPNNKFKTVVGSEKASLQEAPSVLTPKPEFKKVRTAN